MDRPQYFKNNFTDYAFHCMLLGPMHPCTPKRTPQILAGIYWSLVWIFLPKDRTTVTIPYWLRI